MWGLGVTPQIIYIKLLLKKNWKIFEKKIPKYLTKNITLWPKNITPWPNITLWPNAISHFDIRLWPDYTFWSKCDISGQSVIFLIKVWYFWSKWVLFGQSVIFFGQSVIWLGQSVIFWSKCDIFGQSVIFLGQSVIYQKYHTLTKNITLWPNESHFDITLWSAFFANIKVWYGFGQSVIWTIFALGHLVKVWYFGQSVIYHTLTRKYHTLTKISHFDQKISHFDQVISHFDQKYHALISHFDRT